MALTDEDKTWINDELGALETRMLDKLEGMETRLLTAFHQWASPADTRLRGHSGSIAALEMEVGNLIERVAKLEGNKAS